MIFRRATIEDLDMLFATRIEVLRAANGLVSHCLNSIRECVKVFL